MRGIGHSIKRILGMVLRGIRNPRKIVPAVRYYAPYWVRQSRLAFKVRQSRLAFNWILADSPRVYYSWAYNAGTFHPSFKTYDAHPPVPYTLYSLADICHFFDTVPVWNQKPFVVECEHVLYLALAGFSFDVQWALARIKHTEAIMSNDLCRLVLCMSKGIIAHSKRFISNPNLHEKFDYLYPSYPTQASRSMDLSQPFTILTIASEFYRKGIPVALKVFEVLRSRYTNQVRMILVCHCLPENYRLPDGVTLYRVYPLPDALKAKLYTNSHVLFLPALNDTFGCFVEAYAYGTPVVTTRIHHGDETVKEGVTGFLVDPPFYLYTDDYGKRWRTTEEWDNVCSQPLESGVFNDLVEQCVDRLGRLIQGEVDLRKMSAAAQTFHREVFSIEVRNRKLREIYRRVAGLQIQ